MMISEWDEVHNIKRICELVKEHRMQNQPAQLHLHPPNTARLRIGRY